MQSRVLVVALAFLTAGCTASEKAPEQTDSSDVAAFRLQADSIAHEMALAISSIATRTGTWKAAGDSSEWTARMQGEHVAVLEERMVFADSGSAVRGYFFGASGALEQISERRMIRRGTAEQTSETEIDFTDAGARGKRTIDGDIKGVSSNEIEALRRHAAELIAAARAAGVSEEGSK